ncbi:MAG: DsbA family protein [Alphaproteobacteria bacterium]|nr:DsbA family protein [Alphaproteobacteria bacterium]
MSKMWTALLAAAVIAVGGGAWWLKQHQAVPPAPVASAATSASGAAAAFDPVAASKLSSDDRLLGNPDAPVTIIEYASLTCPHCAAFETETLPEIKKEWIDTGKAKLVFRDFPLDGSAIKASLLARCAQPEHFYGLLETLFSLQLTWAHEGDPTEALGRIAKDGGIDDDTFRSCMKDDAMQNKILASRLQGEKEFGVNSTPTFFINGTKLVGAQPYAKFDEALKAASKA